MTGRNRSLWREESLLLHLLQTAISPRLSLAQCLGNWPVISMALREPPRKRELQAARMEQNLHRLS
jgi:hypothetical protein